MCSGSGAIRTLRGKSTSNHYLLHNSWPLHVHLFKELERELRIIIASMLKLQLCDTDHVNAEVELLLHAAVAGGQVHMLLLPDSVWGDWAHWFMIFADFI